jgi:hypothetical protein
MKTSKKEWEICHDVLNCEYGIDPSIKYKLQAQEDEPLNSAASSEWSTKATSKHKNLWKPTLKQCDEVLYDWFVWKFSKGTVIPVPSWLARNKWE